MLVAVRVSLGRLFSLRNSHYTLISQLFLNLKRHLLLNSIEIGAQTDLVLVLLGDKLFHLSDLLLRLGDPPNHFLFKLGPQA